MNILNALKPLHRQMPYKLHVYLPKQKLLFCPIAKNGTTSWKHWMATLAVGQYTGDTHAFEKANLQIRATNPTVAQQALSNTDIFRFSIVRNPWNRIVSAFGNKVVHPDTYGTLQNALKLLTPRSVWKRATTMQEMEQSIAKFTFRQFVHAVTSRPGYTHDAHWRPQYLYLGDVNLDFVGYFENMQNAVLEISRRTGLKVDIQCLNANAYAKEIRTTDSDCYCDVPIGEIRQLSRIPKPHEFYSEDLIECVGDYYHQDVQRFGYEYDKAPARAFAA